MPHWTSPFCTSLSSLTTRTCAPSGACFSSNTPHPPTTIHPLPTPARAWCTCAGSFQPPPCVCPVPAIPPSSKVPPGAGTHHSPQRPPAHKAQRRQLTGPVPPAAPLWLLHRCAHDRAACALPAPGGALHAGLHSSRGTKDHDGYSIQEPPTNRRPQAAQPNAQHTASSTKQRSSLRAGQDRCAVHDNMFECAH